MKPIDYAKAYIDFGWSLIPILPDSKKPAIKWAEFQERRATIEEVTEWIQNGWYLAVVTGDISGVLVVDDDRVKHNLPEWGFESVVSAKSQTQGKHYYFKWDREIHSHSNTELFVDLKAWHSYCLLPPFNGREWISKPSQNLSKLTPITDDIVRLINSDKKVDAQGKAEPLTMSDFVNVQDGARTDSLHRIACSVFTKHTKDDGLRILHGVNLTYNPPLTKEEFEYQVSRAFSFVQSSHTPPNSDKLIPQPKTLGEVGVSRVEERKLERLAAKTGFPELDQLIKGFIPKHLYTLTGETNVGKTAIACNFVHRQSLQGSKCLYLALEPDSTVVDYLASIRLKIPFDTVTDKDVQHDDKNISIYTDEVKTMADLEKVVESVGSTYSLIVIDHIGYFVQDSKNYIQEQARLVKQLALLANKHSIAILIIAHLRKPERNKQDATPTIDDISGSAAFKQDSDEVLIVVRAKDQLDPFNLQYSNQGYMYVAKSKTSGGNGVVNLIFNPKSALIQTPEELKDPTYLTPIKILDLQQEHTYDTTTLNTLKPFLKGAHGH